MEEFGALVVDWSVGFESERDEGLRVVAPSVTLPVHVAESCKKESETVPVTVTSQVIFSALPWDERHAVRSLAVTP